MNCNDLRWCIWKPKLGFFNTPNHSFPLFPINSEYVTISNAAHQIVILGRTTRPFIEIYYCVQMAHNGFICSLRISNNVAVIHTTENGVAASAELILWPRNSRKLCTSIRDTIKLLKIYDVHDS